MAATQNLNQIGLVRFTPRLGFGYLLAKNLGSARSEIEREAARRNWAGCTPLSLNPLSSRFACLLACLLAEAKKPETRNPKP